MELRERLNAWTSDPRTHARWLNSLSYLEYRGFRKIARSQGTEDIDDEVLTHAMEEVRHALFFKRLALKVGGAEFSHYRTDTLLAEAALKKYFYDIDAGSEALLKTVMSERVQRAAYFLVTWLIEERAMSVYGEYEKVLRERELGLTLKPVLHDEARHLEEVAGASRALLTAAGLKPEDFFALEKRCFTDLWEAMA